MSTARLPGTPLRGSVVGDEQITELAEALTAMHGSVPAPAAARLPRRLWNEHQAAAGVHARHERLLQVNAPPEIRQAAAEGMRRLRPAGPGSTPEADVPPVFGQADGYLANFLRDGTSVRIVDFEDSGRSDRAYELADVVEHVSTWVDSDFDVLFFLGLFDLDRWETRRLRECRRLFALLWLPVLALQDPKEARNPVGTAERQAGRLLAALG